MIINGYQVQLVDDGTMDTVISVDGEWLRYSQDFAMEYRDEKTGELNFGAMAIVAFQDFANAEGK